MSERLPSLHGAACSDLAPQVVDKYFDIDAGKQVWEAKTAKAICSHCPVQGECLEEAMRGPELQRGIRAGLAANQITTLKQWEAYDSGARETPPRRPRPVPLEVTPVKEVMDDYRERSTMSFEECVQLVFSEIQAGKYARPGGIKAAIGAIAAVHYEKVSEVRSE